MYDASSDNDKLLDEVTMLDGEVESWIKANKPWFYRLYKPSFSNILLVLMMSLLVIFIASFVIYMRINNQQIKSDNSDSFDGSLIVVFSVFWYIC